MTFVRHRRWWLTAVLILLMLCLFVPGALSIWLNYPVAVTFDFTYRKQPYHIAYVTLMRIRFCGDFRCIVEWLPGRSTVSVALRDGSLVVLSPYWPWSWEKDFSTVRGRASWIWLDNPSAPTEIVIGEGSERPSESDRESFPTLIVDATIERVSRFYQFTAFVRDRSADDADPVLASSRFRLFNFSPNGRLFAEIEATLLTLQGPWIRHSSDWIDLDGGCRILFRTPQNVDEANEGAAPDSSQTRSLLRSFSKEGDLWSFDEKPGPGRGKPSVTYDTGTKGYVARDGGIAIPDLVRPALDQVRNIKHEGKICHIPEWPKDSFNADVDFGHGQIFFVTTSLAWVLVRD